VSAPAALFVWRSSWRAFALRSCGVFVLTYVLLTPVWPLVGGLSASIAAICLSLIYMFVLDDFSEWFRHRHATWTLTSSELIYQNPTEDMAPHHLPLSEIKALTPIFWWALVVRLSNGTAITMTYMDKPRTLRAHILQAQAAADFS